MKKPQMILFDYGHTLLYETDFDMERGEQEVFRHIRSNPRQVTPKEAAALNTQIWLQFDSCRKQGTEIPMRQMMHLEYELLGIELSVDFAEAEKLMWRAAAGGACMPQVHELLACLARSGIRSGVISNLGWSGEALKDRIDTLLPENRFEFIFASSDYGVRKPEPMLFRAALRRAGLAPEEVWYCGDSVRADIYGAHGAGIFPVWYDNQTIENPWAEKTDGTEIPFEHLHIHEWEELIRVLEAV